MKRIAKRDEGLLDEFRIGSTFPLRRHLSRGDTIVNPHPMTELVRLRKVVAERLEVETGLGVLAVTAKAGGFDKRGDGLLERWR